MGICDTCLRAKQTGSQLFTSESKADGLLDLIHCDIWGPYKIASFYGAYCFLTIVDDASRLGYT